MTTRDEKDFEAAKRDAVEISEFNEAKRQFSLKLDSLDKVYIFRDGKPYDVMNPSMYAVVQFCNSWASSDRGHEYSIRFERDGEDEYSAVMEATK